MIRASLVALLMAFAWAVPAYAEATASPKEAVHQDKKAIHREYQTLATDNDEIRALDKQRDDALRANNAAAAEQIQKQIDQKRAALKGAQATINKDETDMQRQKRLEAEQCAKDPACAKRKKEEMLTRQLDGLRAKLRADQAAADRIPQDKEAVDKLEAELKQ